MPTTQYSRLGPVVCAWFALTALAATAAAQGSSDCQAPQRPSLGGMFGWTSPSAELTRDAVDVRPGESPALEGGNLIGARADASIVGPLRVRVEASAMRWSLARRSYTLEGNHGIVSSIETGRMPMRQAVASIGLAGGRPPLCAHVLAGGGLYALGYQGATFRTAGFALTAGVDLPVGNHGVFQADAHFHMVGTPPGVPIGSTQILVAAFTVGWAYRF